MDMRHRSADDGGIDLIHLCYIAWRHRVGFTVACSLCVIAALVIALTMTPIFRSEITVTHARDSEMNENGTGAELSSQIGSLASLAGINVPDMQGQDQQSDAVLNSDRLIREFITRYNLLPQLSTDPEHPITLWRGVRNFKRSVLVIAKDDRKGVTTVDVKWTNPRTAALWANNFVALANDLIRSRAQDEATRNLAYLNEQIDKTSVVEVRTMLYALVETETRKLMLVNSRPEYAFVVVDPGVAAEVRDSPKRTLIVSVGLIIGLLIGILTATVLERFARERSVAVLRSGRTQPAGMMPDGGHAAL